MEKYILSLDQGTTSTRAILFDKRGHECFDSFREVKCSYPKSGWVEADPLDLWVSVIEVINEILIKANISFANIDSIGISNQRETTVVWEKESGMPVYPAIVWQSRQSGEICEQYMDKKEYIHEKTGLLINPYFSATKIRFILDHIPNGQQRAESGSLMAGTIDTWIIYKMTKGRVFKTDVSNASRTMLYNINEMKWDDDLLRLFNIPKCLLAQVCPSSSNYGIASFFSDSVPICGVAGDQQSALFGHTCFNPGSIKCTYGTGCFALLNTGDAPIYSKQGLLTTIAWQIGDKVTYALEGSVFIGGAVVQWLRDEMKMIHTSDESEVEANRCESSNGIYVVPAFVGLGTPYWDDEVRGSVFGLTRDSNRHQFVRACLEAIAYQCKDVLEVMKKETSMSLKSLRVDGGATKNNYLLQFQSDILPAIIERPSCRELTALGVCYLSGLYTGFFPSLEEISSIHEVEKVFKPEMTRKEVASLYSGWKLAVKASRVFKKH
ncbi:MAG: glycerol kinase GlpK [Coprobacillus sp.]|nr:glycerol kinase GlpK [Coprobacillus sp.]